MVWYNPFTWFEQRRSALPQFTLYSDNPQCGQLLRSSAVAYDSEHREVYHGFDCARFAVAHRTFTSREMNSSHVEEIPLRKAMFLLTNGRLKQSPSLEDRIIPP